MCAWRKIVRFDSAICEVCWQQLSIITYVHSVTVSCTHLYVEGSTNNARTMRSFLLSSLKLIRSFSWDVSHDIVK